MDFSTSSLVKKNGLLYSEDLKTVVGVDSDSTEFTGRVPFGPHYIAPGAFSDSSLDSISLPDSVVEMGDGIFDNAAALTKVKLPYAIKSIPPYIFSGCSSLEKVTLPNDLQAFPEGMFYNCSSLKEPVFRPAITSVPENAYAGCTSIRALVLPDYIQTIGPKAFAGCTSLASVIIPGGIMDIAPDAFEGCTSLTNIRFAGDNRIYFVNNSDGCVYERTADDDKLIIKVASVEKQTVNFFAETVDDSPDPFFTDEDVNEIDETFSSEVEAGDEEIAMMSSEPILNDDMAYTAAKDEIQISREEEQSIMEDMGTSPVTAAENNDAVNSMLADIMNEEKARAENVESVAVSEKETQILTEMMDVMNDKADVPDNGAKVSEEELAQLFANNESSEPTGDNIVVDQKEEGGIDSKTQILLDNVAFSKVVECAPEGEAPADADLFVVAEKTVVGANGSPAFSAKLDKCCRTFAHIQDFKRIIFLNGLPVDNEEFMQFYHYYIAQRNVVFACEAPSPAKLSEYGKQVCEQSRISLERDELIAQRKKISIKNNTLIKLVIQDKYED